MISRRFPILVLSMSLLLALPSQANSEWELQDDDDGIRLYTREVPGSPFLEVRATTEINTTLEQLLAAFGDGVGCPDWRENCKSSRLLREAGEGERYIYMVLDLPWPMSDRDMVIRSVSQVDRQASTATVEVSSVDGEYPEQDYVRAWTRASYRVEPGEPGRVALTYTVHVELGGDVSPGMVNGRLAESTRKEFANLVELAAR